MVTYYQCKLHGRSIIQLEDFGLVHAIVRMRATSLDGGIMKMLIYDPILASYESRVESNQVVTKEKKKSNCCNLKLIVLIIIVCFLFLSLTKNVKDESC
ncbi:hypothetical protein H5410_051550, partial [Solanum commersonii]